MVKQGYLMLFLHQLRRSNGISDVYFSLNISYSIYYIDFCRFFMFFANDSPIF